MVVAAGSTATMDGTSKRSRQLTHPPHSTRPGEFQLVDASSDYHAAVRVGVGRAAQAWPLTKTAAFSSGNSIFEVVDVELHPTPAVSLAVRTGPRKGETLVVGRDGATLGRATDNTVCIPDRELSRRHSRVSFSAEGDTPSFYVSDLGSTNGTYVQLVGPYAGRYPLHLNDHILVGRTGFSVNRFDFGISEETGMRRSMEDKVSAFRV